MAAALFFLLSIGLLVLCLFILEKKIAITPVRFVIGILVLIVPVKYLFLDYFDFAMIIVTDVKYLFYASVAICAFSFITMLTVAVLSVKDPKLVYLGYRPSNLVIGASFLLFVCTCMLVIIRVGIDGLFDPISFRRALESGGALYITQFYVLTVSLAIVMVSAKRWPLKMLFYGIHFGFCVAAGRPGYLLLYFLNIMFSSNNRKPRTFSFYSVAVVLFIPLLSIFALRYRLAKSSNSSVIETTSIVIRDLELTDLSAVVSLFFLRSDQLEHFSNFIGSVVEQQIEPSLRGLGASVLQFIPRSFMPDKTPTFSSGMTGFHYPEVFAVGVTNNFLGISEFISYFGLLGTLICGIYVGILLKVLVLYAEKSVAFPAVYYVMFNLIFLYVFNGIMSGFFNDWALQCFLLNLFYMSFLGRWIVYK